MNEEGLNKLTDEIIDGKRLTRENPTDFFQTADQEALSRCADRLRKHFRGNRTDLCSIISGKSGKCPENCRFCAQSAHYNTGCDVHGLLDYERIYEEACMNQQEGVDRFAIVISGKSPSEADFEKIIEIYERLYKNLKISLCASLGFLTAEQFRRLYKAGVRSYHNNIETGRDFFSMICTTHSFQDKVANIERAKAAGLSVCSGGIIGMGETFRDRVDMAFTLAELGAASIPINALMPIPGTPLQNLMPLSKEEILRTIAMFRFINPEKNIRLAAGRRLLGDNGRSAFLGGVSATITGNMLTTTGSTIREDRQMLQDMGRLS